MQFKGHLLLPDEPGPGLRVNLDVAEHHLAVVSDGGGLGAWPLEVVDVERLHGDLFALTVAGEQLRFVADDTISFAYSGIPTIERISHRPPKTRNRSGFRTVLDRIWNGPDESARSAKVDSVEEPSRYTSLEEDTSPEPTVDESPEPTMDEVGEVVEDRVPEPKADPTPDVVEERVSESQVDEIPLITEVAEISVIDDDVIDVREEAIPPSRTDASQSSPADEDLTDTPRCPGIRSDGRRCESAILTTSGYCYSHDPKRVFEDKYKAAQEARAQLRRDATERLNRIYRRLDKAVRQVERGELDPETAMAMAQLASTMCAILEMNEAGVSNHR